MKRFFLMALTACSSQVTAKTPEPTPIEISIPVEAVAAVPPRAPVRPPTSPVAPKAAKQLTTDENPDELPDFAVGSSETFVGGVPGGVVGGVPGGMIGGVVSKNGPAPMTIGSPGVTRPVRKGSVPPAELSKGTSGIVLVTVVVEANGSVSTCGAIKLIPNVDGSALCREIKTWTYTPGTFQGKDVAIKQTLTFRVISP